MSTVVEGIELSPRTRKFRQAAFVYLHVGILYEFSVYAIWRAGLMGDVPGNPVVWLAVGAIFLAAIFWGLWFRESRWLARLVWAIHGLRLPALFEGAFFRQPGEGVVPANFYLVAIIVVVINLWMLARAGWDL